jgi:hypothetical protein
MDQLKVQAVLEWSVPRSARVVWAFLGLVCYNRRFIRDYDMIVTPFTRLLRKGAFKWGAEVENAFHALQLPKFTWDFIVECDTSSCGFGTVLHQGAGPVAFYNKQIASCNAKLTAYERELIGLVLAVRHWRPYLWGHPFLIRTDHYNLKFLLDQKLATNPQH